MQYNWRLIKSDIQENFSALNQNSCISSAYNEN